MIIAIVGIDGSGKSTQAKMLVDKLNQQGFNVEYVRPIYAILDLLPFVKKIVLQSISPRAQRTTSIADVNKYSLSMKKVFSIIIGYPYILVTYLIMKWFIGKEKIIVCDRYFYQFLYDIYNKYSYILIDIIPKPDISFFLYGDIDVLYSRMEYLRDKEVKENYYKDVLKLFSKLSERDDFLRIDAELSKEAIHNIIYNTSMKKMEGFWSEKTY